MFAILAFVLCIIAAITNNYIILVLAIICAAMYALIEKDIYGDD